jgi:hypothetical protein
MNLGSYFQKEKKENRCRDFPYRISFQKKDILFLEMEGVV